MDGLLHRCPPRPHMKVLGGVSIVAWQRGSRKVGFGYAWVGVLERVFCLHTRGGGAGCRKIYTDHGVSETPAS